MQQSENQEFNWDNVWETDNNQENLTNDDSTPQPSNDEDWNWESNLEEDMVSPPPSPENTIPEDEWDWEETNNPSPPPTTTNEEELDKPKIDPLTNVAEDAHLPFVSEVESFNKLFNKPNNYTPQIGNKDDWMFVYNFIKEELEEYKTACENNDLVGIVDALCDITYVSLGNGTMLHGLKTKIWPSYMEVQNSNLSKACRSAQEALETVKQRTKEQEEPCHVEQFGDMYIVYRTRDRKVMKNIYYSEPDLEQFFTQEELDNALKPNTNSSTSNSEKIDIDTLSEKTYEEYTQDDTNTNEEDTW